MEFETFYFYTNQRALKNYLVNYKIEPVAYRNESNMTLSDLGQNYLLFWKNGIDANVVMKHCKSDNSNVPVVLKVSLPSDRIVEAFFPNDNIKTVKIADCASAYAVKIVYPITFFNVSDIFYIDKQIQFLQGDTTLIIPKQLFKKEAYKISEGLNDSIVNCVIKSFSKPEEGSLLEDEDDEAELNINILSDYTCENDVEKNIREASQKEDRIIAAKLMFIQGKTPYDGSFTPRLHSVIDRCGIPFDKIIYDNFYKNVLPDIVSNNIRYLSGNDDFYIAVLTGRKTDEVYAPAISAILQNNYSYDDKERFLNDYLVRIDASSREQIKEVFADRRVRNRIRLLLNDNPKLVPIYFLYTFFDYRLDRFCDNIIEYDLVKEGCANITLSLWGLLHGMADVYSEYKNYELLYAIANKDNDGCVGYEQFARNNSIVSKKDYVLIDNISCGYINPKIEYYHCVGMHDEKIKKLIDSLTKELKNVFDFQYVSLKSILKSTNTNISDTEILANKDAIHKRYLQLLQKAKTKKQRKSSKPMPIQASIFD